jgi:hypothetical protein
MAASVELYAFDARADTEGAQLEGGGEGVGPGG